MNRFKKAILIGGVLLTCTGCDQVTKSIAVEHLTIPEPIRLLGDTIRLQSTSNTGGFLGLGAGFSEPVRFWIFIVLSAATLAGAVWYAWSAEEADHPLIVLGISLILGGGFSNLIDRVVNNGKVVDFMNVGIGGLRTGIFNVADVAIMAGPVVLLFGAVALYKAEKAAQAEVQPGEDNRVGMG